MIIVEVLITKKKIILFLTYILKRKFTKKIIKLESVVSLINRKKDDYIMNYTLRKDIVETDKQAKEVKHG